MGVDAMAFVQSDVQEWHAAPTMSQLRVMIFGDDAAFRRMTRQSLRDIGIIRTIEAGTTDCPKSSLQAHSGIDVIVSDLNLRKGNGIYLLKAIRMGRVLGIRSDVCLILVADTADTKTLAAAAQLNAGGFLVKPINVARLKTAVLRGWRKKVSADLQQPRDLSTTRIPTFAPSHLAASHQQSVRG